MHTINVVLLIGDAALNCLVSFVLTTLYTILYCFPNRFQPLELRHVVSFFLFVMLCSQRFPLFRIGYFFMWTVIYVIFQWILHARVSIW